MPNKHKDEGARTQKVWVNGKGAQRYKGCVWEGDRKTQKRFLSGSEMTQRGWVC